VRHHFETEATPIPEKTAKEVVKIAENSILFKVMGALLVALVSASLTYGIASNSRSADSIAKAEKALTEIATLKEMFVHLTVSFDAQLKLNAKVVEQNTQLIVTGQSKDARIGELVLRVEGLLMRLQEKNP
jgi:hypothetical protein